VIKRSLAILPFVAVASVPAAASSAAISPARAVAQATAEWLADIRAAAESGDRSAGFPSPPRAVLMRRLGEAEKLYGFRIVSVQMLRTNVCLTRMRGRGLRVPR